MKKLLLALLLVVGVHGFGQQSVTFAILVMDTSGAAVANQPVVGTYQSTNGPVSISGATGANGTFIDSALIVSQSSLVFFTAGGGCADSTIIVSNNTTSFYSDTLVICGSGGSGNCNYTVSALPIAGVPNAAFFSYSGGSVGGGTNILWDFGDGNTSNQISPSHTYAQPGTYYYCLTLDSCPPVCDSITVFGGGGCDPFFFKNVNGSTVDIFPNLLTGQFQAIVDWGDGQLDTFTPQNIPSLPNNISHTYSANGNYQICFTHSNANLGCSNTFCDSVSINSGSAPCQALWTVDTVNSINFAGNVMLWNLSTGGTPGTPLNYIWDWGDGSTSTGPYPMHSYSDTGIYFVCLTINDPVSGCTDTYCDSLGFDANGNLVYKNTSYTGFTVQVVDPATVSTPEYNLDRAIDIYPNPSQGEVNITSELSEINTVLVFDLNGRLLERIEPGTSQQGRVELMIRDKGMYLIRILTNSGTVTKKLIVD